MGGPDRDIRQGSADSSDPRPCAGTRLGFADLVLDTRRRELTRGGDAIALPRLSYRLLLTLVDAAPGMVTQDELMARVWPGQVVSPETLTQRVGLLRRALGDDAHAPRYVGLARGEGYRLLPAVVDLPHERRAVVADASHANVPDDAPPHANGSDVGRSGIWRRPAYAMLAGFALVVALVSYVATFDRDASRTKDDTSPIRLAIRPFENVSGDLSHKYFSVGVAEELTMRVARLRSQSLIVVGNETMSALDADYLLEGTIRQDPGGVYITARLIRTRDESHVWAASYQRDAGAIIPIQSEIATSVARAAGILSATEPQEPRLPRVVDGDAHEAYLKGRYLLDAGGSEQSVYAAMAEFRRAIALDSDYATAYAALAFCYNRLGSGDYLPPAEAYPAARAAAHAALEIDAGLADAWAALAFVRRNYDWDWRGAEEALLEALRLDPNNPQANHVYGLLLSSVGRHEEAIFALRRSTEFDPASPIAFSNLAQVHVNARQYDRARAIWGSRSEVLGSETFQLIQADFHLLLGEFASAIEILSPLTERAWNPSAVASLARAYASMGRESEARRLLRQLESDPSARYALSPHIARGYAALGDLDAAFSWIDVALEERAARLIYAKVDPSWDQLRSDARFSKVLHAMHLDEV